MSSATPDVITFPMMRQALYSAVLCDALDSLGFPNQSPRVQLPPMTVTAVLVGRAKTTLWADMHHRDPRPYELELQAVDGCQADDVLIAAAGGSMHSGIWGELLSTAARNRGCVGAVVDGAVRDVTKMAEMGFPVFARGVCVYDSRDRQRVIDLDVTVMIGGVQIAPGDLIIADRDGVVVAPQRVEREAIRAAWEKVHAENAVRDAIRDGLGAVDAFNRFGVL